MRDEEPQAKGMLDLALQHLHRGSDSTKGSRILTPHSFAEREVPNNTKYEMTDVRWPGNHRLRAIRAKRDIPLHGVKVGDIGGYIEKLENLSEDGDAWVAHYARVTEKAHVSGDALVTAWAHVSGCAQICGSAAVGGHAEIRSQGRVLGEARVFGHARVQDSARVGQSARVCDSAIVADLACARGMATVRGESVLCDNGTVGGEAVIEDRARVFDDAAIGGKTRVCHNAHVGGRIRLVGRRVIDETVPGMSQADYITPEQTSLLDDLYPDGGGMSP